MPDLPVLAQKIAVWAIPVLLAVTVHEVAHGLAAQRLGDDTAARAGRLSLNPLRHVDPLGTVLIPALLLLFKAPFLFGWARPVPVNFARLNSPRRDMALVAFAGPFSNLLMAVLWAGGLAMAYSPGALSQSQVLLLQMCQAGVVINLVLMVLNLVPLPPLDGGRIAVSLLPAPADRWLARVEPFGLLVIVALLATGVLSQILYWPLALSELAIYRMLGLGVTEP